MLSVATEVAFVFLSVLISVLSVNTNTKGSEGRPSEPLVSVPTSHLSLTHYFFASSEKIYQKERREKLPDLLGVQEVSILRGGFSDFQSLYKVTPSSRINWFHLESSGLYLTSCFPPVPQLWCIDLFIFVHGSLHLVSLPIRLTRLG